MRKTFLLGIAALLVLLTGCAQEPAEEKEPIRIGAVLSLTGPAASFGDFSKKAIELAAEEINGEGGINGRHVELFIEDDKTSPKDGVLAFKKLTEVDKVDAVIGSMWDFTTQPLLPLADASETTLISPSNFRIEGSFDLGEHSFVMLNDLSTVIRRLENFVDESDFQKIAVVRFGSSFGTEIAKTFGEIMEDLGRDPIIDETYSEIGQADFRTIILKLQQEKPDAVFLDMLDMDLVTFLKNSEELGFDATIMNYVSVFDALANPDVEAELLNDVIILNWEVHTDEFKEKFKQRYNTEPAKHAQKSYDALYVLAEAVANTEDKAQVSNYLEQHAITTPNQTIEFTESHGVKELKANIHIVRDGTPEMY